MKTNLWLLPCLALAALAQTAEAPKKFAVRKLQEQLLGAWKLISLESRAADGKITHPMGQAPTGRITYDGFGRMSAQIMGTERPRFRSDNRREGTVEEKAAAYDGYIAYYGTYTVKPSEDTVVHHVEASLYPNWVGGDQVRRYAFAGRQLILRAAMPDGSESRVVWERAR